MHSFLEMHGIKSDSRQILIVLISFDEDGRIFYGFRFNELNYVNEHTNSNQICKRNNELEMQTTNRKKMVGISIQLNCFEEKKKIGEQLKKRNA